MDNLEEIDHPQLLVLLMAWIVIQYGALLAIEHPHLIKKCSTWVNRRYWEHPINAKRKELGFYYTLYHELREDEKWFVRYTRMSVEAFDYLLQLISHRLIKTSRREPLSPEHRLLITLRYLATGDIPFSIALHYRVGESTVYAIIEETCSVISQVLRPIYVSPPNEDEWIEICAGFADYWHMPNCAGAIDGKLVDIIAPEHSGSVFFNYHKRFSLHLLAVCDYKYKFTLVDIGACGGESDGGVLLRSEFGKALLNEQLNFPSGYANLGCGHGCQIIFRQVNIPRKKCPKTTKSSKNNAI